MSAESLSSGGRGGGSTRRLLFEVAFVVAWSSGFVGATLGTQFAGASTLLAWRFFFAAAVMLGWVLLMRRGWPSVHEFGVQVVLGLLSQVVYLGCIVGSAEIEVSGGIAALIAALQPLFAAALAGPLLGERVIGRQWVGLGLGLVGVLFIVGENVRVQSSVPTWAYVLPFIGMAGLVMATLVERGLARRNSGKEPSVSLDTSLAIQFTVSAMVFGSVALAQGELVPPESAGFWFSVVWVILLSSFGGYGFYWLNVRLSGVTRVSSLLYLTPPTTMVWSLLMFGDRIGAFAFAGLAVCVVGVSLARGERSD